ncbi:MAG: RNA polymerase sigma factor [Acidimicrobiales bacterium]
MRTSPSTSADGEGLNAGTLYRRLAPQVLGYLRSQRVPEAEDVLGEVFVQVARDLKGFKGDDDACRRWVFSIAHNRMVDAFRRENRRRDEPGEVPEVAVHDDLDGVDPALAAALDGLTPDQREVVVLRFVADLSIEAVAKVTRRRVGAVKALQHRALKNLEQAVSPEG